MISEEQKRKFLAILGDTANVSKACRTAEFSRQAAYDHRKSDPEFAAEWDDALETACDDLEETARRRAKADSDTLLIFLLKAHRPQKFRDNVQHTHDGGVTIRVEYADDHAPTPPPALGPTPDPE